MPKNVIFKDIQDPYAIPKRIFRIFKRDPETSKTESRKDLFSRFSSSFFRFRFSPLFQQKTRKKDSFPGSLFFQVPNLGFFTLLQLLRNCIGILNILPRNIPESSFSSSISTIFYKENMLSNSGSTLLFFELFFHVFRVQNTFFRHNSLFKRIMHPLRIA